MMKRPIFFLLSMLLYGFDRAVSGVGQLLGKPPRGRRTVLVYHGVNDAQRGAFEAQMEQLVRHTRPVSVEAFRKPSWDRTDVTLVTFDDAYEEIFRNAIPVLRRRRIPCVVFVLAGYVGKEPGWTRRSGKPGSLPMVASASLLKQHLQPGLVYGVHGMMHRSLYQASPGETEQEVVDSRASLENMLGTTVSVFAFPYGHYDLTHVDLCRDAGYAAVFAVDGHQQRREDAGYLFTRVPVAPSDHPIEYLLKIRGAYRWHGAAVRLKSRAKATRRSRMRHEGSHTATVTKGTSGTPGPGM